MTDFYAREITLIDKNQINVTSISIEGDAALGNLNQYKKSARWSDTINGKTKNATLTLRCPDGLFLTKGPILTDENTKDLYLVQARMSQGAELGTLFRFELSKVTKDTGEKGLHLSIELTGYDIRIQEYIDPENHRLQTPKETFLNRIGNFLGGRSLAARNVKITDNPALINLPDTANLKQDWLVSSPVTTRKHFDEIISRISKPEIIGSTNEDWYYNIFPTSAAFTESFTILADKMGTVDSGVILDENDSTIIEKVQGSMDNTKFKNVVIARAKNGTHSIPMGFTTLASDITHAKLADDWSGSSVSYLNGDFAKHNGVLFKSIIDHTSSGGNPPDTSPTLWENLNASTRGSDWTSDLSYFQNNISYPAQTDYAGFFNDFNIVKPHFDRADVFDEFETVTLKDVIDFIPDPPISPKHGQRWLVNGGGTGAWTGQNNRVAQYDALATPTAVWRFSVLPIEGDIVHVKSLARQLRFESGVWQNVWTLDDNSSVASAFHPIKSITQVTNRNNISKAIEFRFNWNAFTAASVSQDILNISGGLAGMGLVLFGVSLDQVFADVADFLSKIGKTEAEMETEFGGGDIRNAASRWFGWSVTAPFGSAGDAARIDDSIIDFQNLNSSIHTGAKGMNNGLDSENLGIFRALEYWCKMRFNNKQNNAINGLAKIPKIHWFRDLSDRIVYTETFVRAHDNWQKITVPVGKGSNFKLHDSRIDELFTMFGYTFPHDHFIKERELTGVEFDWTKVREMGCFYRDSYNDNFFYTGAQSKYPEAISEHLAQYAANFVGAATASQIDAQNLVIDHCLYALDDMHFLKDAYVTSSETAQDSPRMIQIETPQQSDYNNIKGIVQRKESRLQFHPELHLIDCRGDVRIKPGHKITLRGSTTVADRELVPTEVTHIDDDTGYHVQAQAIRKFAV